jgi:hypothetical protein
MTNLYLQIPFLFAYPIIVPKCRAVTGLLFVGFNHHAQASTRLF